jgi:hypothetical protein
MYLKETAREDVDEVTWLRTEPSGGLFRLREQPFTFH